LGFRPRQGITRPGYEVDTRDGMNDALAPINGGRGSDLLLEHCAALTRVGAVRQPAYHRLEQEVGGDLARLLVGALAGRRRQGARLAA